MKPPPRPALLAGLLACGAGLILLLARTRPSTPLESSLATPFQLLGTPAKLIDRLASRAIPVGSLEERDLGDTFRRRYEVQIDPHHPDQAYLDALMRSAVQPHTRRPFPYRAYLIGAQGSPNAMALPGGVILVSRELLGTLRSEAELVSVLAHEAGHIELGHCFDAVRFQLLARKGGSEEIGSLADLAAAILLRHTYGKTSEHEADEYAYALLRASRYDPGGSGASFTSLLAGVNRRGERDASRADVLRDYALSHPPLKIRETEFQQRAQAWWRRHPQERRYVGRANLRLRRPLGELSLASEWRSSRPAQATR
jgi:predicted Zn-dependent protease